MTLRVVPVNFSDAARFVTAHHRHHCPPTGHKFSLGVADDMGRPVGRGNQDGLTLEVTRTCTVVAERPARKGWDTPSRPRHPRGTEGIARTLWEATA